MYVLMICAVLNLRNFNKNKRSYTPLFSLRHSLRRFLITVLHVFQLANVRAVFQTFAYILLP
jgi:hypothetical protein